MRADPNLFQTKSSIESSVQPVELTEAGGARRRQGERLRGREGQAQRRSSYAITKCRGVSRCLPRRDGR
jgi:hypothetical protein